MRNRFKGLDLIDRVPDELWNEVHDIVQETEIKTIPMEKELRNIHSHDIPKIQLKKEKKNAPISDLFKL